MPLHRLLSSLALQSRSVVQSQAPVPATHLLFAHLSPTVHGLPSSQLLTFAL